MTKLFDIIGKAISGEWGSDDENNTGIPVIRTTNFTNEGNIDYSNVVTRNIKKKNIGKKFLKQGDIIIEKSGGSDDQPVGRVVYFNGPNDRYLFNNFTGLLRIKDTTKWYPRYVFWVLYASYKQGKTKLYQNRTTGLHNLRTDAYVKDLDINFIPLEEQKHISEVLDKVRLQIELKKKELSKLDTLIKARFVEMYGDPIINNKHLTEVSMTQICQIIDGDRGKNYPHAKDFESEGYCLFLNAKNVTKNGFNFENCSYISKERDELLRKGRVERGDIVLTTRGTIGNLALYTNDIPYERLRINSGMVILRMDHTKVLDRFFIEQFKMQLEKIKLKVASGSAQPQLPVFTMNKIKIVLPSTKAQNEFALFVQQVDKSKVVIQKSLDETQTLFDSLMQKYFS